MTVIKTIDLDETELDIHLEYPRSQGNLSKILIDLIDVRSAMPILVEFDFDRNGWAITQLIDPDGLMGYEVAFIDAWRDEVDPIEKSPCKGPTPDGDHLFDFHYAGKSPHNCMYCGIEYKGL